MLAAVAVGAGQASRRSWRLVGAGHAWREFVGAGVGSQSMWLDVLAGVGVNGPGHTDGFVARD